MQTTPIENESSSVNPQQNKFEKVNYSPMLSTPLAPPAQFIRTHSGRDIPFVAPALDDFSIATPEPLVTKPKVRHSQLRPSQDIVDNSLSLPRVYGEMNHSELNVPTSSGLLPSFLKDTRNGVEKFDDDEDIPAHEKSLWKLLSTVGTKTLAGVDFVGGFLARNFGITSHRYEWQLDDAEEYELDMKNSSKQKTMKRATSSFLREEIDENEWRMNSHV